MATITGTGVGEPLAGTASADKIFGLGGDDTLTGLGGNDTLDGGADNDLLKGGAGNDIYIVDSVDDDIDEEGNIDKNDTVKSSVTINLATMFGGAIESLTLTDVGNIDGTGNAQKNTIIGNNGNNHLDGAAGLDVLKGGLGDDLYTVDLVLAGTKSKLEDTVTEAAKAGTDTLELRAAGDLGLLVATKLTLNANFENFDVSQTGVNKLNLTGNALGNTITGNDADNVIDGAAGNDTLIGGKGNDTLTGGLGKDDLSGGEGNDIYNVTDIDTVHELVGEGIDLVKMTSAVAFKAGTTDIMLFDLNTDFANVENFTLLGTQKGNIDGNADNNTLTGNAARNQIGGEDGDDSLFGGAGNDDLFGNSGDDILDGGTGADVMKGGIGNDTYYIDNVLDEIQGEVSGVIGGKDIVYSSVTIELAAGIEELFLTGTKAINALGCPCDNIIHGNDAANVLDGKSGIDTLIGGKGGDTYVIHDTFDIVQEIIAGATGGIDLVKSEVSFDLSDDTGGNTHSNIENLTLTAGFGDIDGTGNALKNLITGNEGNNVLNGGAGNDTLVGGLGNDELDGGANVDILKGEKGDDSYTVDLIVAAGHAKLQDTVTEAANAGHDTLHLRTSGDLGLLVATKLTLNANFEDFDASQTGTNKLNLTGNALANTITGNDGDNVIDGGAGNDILIGGNGHDTLIGGTGVDTFRYRDAAEGGTGEVITGFVKGAGGDILDLHDLLVGFTADGYDGTNALSSGFVTLTNDGTNTTVHIDADGTAGGGVATDLVVLNNVVLHDTDTSNMIL